ncbi:MAG: PTS mannose/fructose/sorbose transporter subunit IIC [Candidatus Makana argininalis]
MNISTMKMLFIFLFSCFSGIESVLDEFQFHRPLISCSLIGLILGDIKTGTIIGSTLEMISMGWMNIGASMSPDSSLASIISTILVISGNQTIGSGIALAIPLAATGQLLTIIIRTINVAFQHAADKAAENGNLKLITLIHLSALILQAMRIAIPSLMIGISLKTNLIKTILESIPEVITNGLNVSGGIIVIVGYAMVINMMKAGYLMPFFYLGFVISSFSKFNLVSFGMIGIIISIIYIQLNPKYFNKFKKKNISKKKKINLDNELD